jgi:hypothetical protein
MVRGSPMRIAPTFFVFISAAGCNVNGGASTPEQAVRRYLSAKTVAARLPFVVDADSIRHLLQGRSGISQVGFDEANLQPPERIAHAGEWYTIRVAARRGSEVTEMQLYAGRQDGAKFKIDWKASAGYNPVSVSSILVNETEPPPCFRLKARLETYYYHDFWGTEARYQSVELTEEGYNVTLHGYVRRQSECGGRLLQLIEDGASHSVMLILRRRGPRGDSITDPQADVVTITEIISDSWLE